MIIFWSLVFVISLALLIKSSNKFTLIAEVIGSNFGIPSFIIGIIIVGIGTSLPELISSVIATYRGFSDIALANIAGSNIANIFLVLGLSVLILNNHIKSKNFKQSLSIDLIVMLISTLLFSFFILDGKIVFNEALVFLSGLLLYFIFSIIMHSNNIMENFGKIKILDIIEIIFWPILIYVGAKYTIEALIEISNHSGLSTSVLSASAIALGTSLPELTVSIQAIRKGKISIAFGNIVGSNIFNILGVTGIAGLFGVLTIDYDFAIVSIVLMLLSSFMLVILRDKILWKWLGLGMFLIYVFFIYFLIF